ncbi:restriction endonuclease subunit S [Vibrio parahaemolyticus]|uniref:restriction endonuclease subunit S n=1 Tax=Vibrio parahaemolyticus TaxID=670 RepID=UPI0009F126A3|nr:restriction endonuclease subunit S [Vibrio parahaemolyticus]EIU7550321.1 restriction endonuclease subunit S [Vibrio vulnificus]OQU27862.1 hypothetical protein EM47_000020 [Vibrio parahaemolyticus]
MTGRYKAYPEYRKSMIEWMDDVPVHWQNTPLKYMAIENNSLFLDGDWIESKDISSDGIRYITTGNVGEGVYKEQGAGFISDETFKKLACTEVFEGDVLLSRLNAPIGRACIVPNLSTRIVTSVDNVIFRPDPHYYKQFLVYLFSSASYFKHTSNLARGATMQRISRGLLGNIRVAIPSLEEQQKIANFLDHETAKIDTLITKQEKLIELLKEKRQAVISHAVTKGLNPDAPMKDSGVDWLGEVPEHWVVCRLKHIKGKDKGSFVDGPFGSNLKSEHFINNGDVYVIESNFATTGSLDISKLKTISTSHFETISRSETKEGAIIIAKIGARYGMSSVLPQLPKRAVVSGNSLSLKVDEEKMDVQYSHQLLSHLKQEGAMDDGVNVTAQPALSLGQLNNLPFLCPPKEEQNDIVSFIQHQNESFSALIESATKMIELSKERKTALISAAVTGKIDVRDWQEPTYQESA